MMIEFQALVEITDDGLKITAEKVTHEDVWTALQKLINTYQFVSGVSADRLEPDQGLRLEITTTKQDHPTFVVVPGGTGSG